MLNNSWEAVSVEVERVQLGDELQVRWLLLRLCLDAPALARLDPPALEALLAAG